MSFLSPFMFALGALAAAVAVALHLLTTRRPPRAMLPTARFVPMSEARAVSRSKRPTDLLLLASRVLAALLLGAAFARPVLDAPGPSVRSVVMLDVSSNVAAPEAAAGLAAERLTEGGVLVVFDTVARALGEDSIAARIGEGKRGAGADGAAGARAASQTPPRASRGSISAALVSAMRAARYVARGADSVRLVLVSPLAEEEFDAATDALRAEWPGAIDLVRVAAVTDSARGVPVRLVSALDDDPLAPALVRLPAARGAHEVRLVRTEPSAADSAWARGAGRDVGRDVGRVLVHWPFSGDETAVADGVTAFGLREATLVAPLIRLSIDTTGRSRVVARWRDGAVAVVESPLGEGCVRRVGVGIALAGDITLRAPFERFLAEIVEPCGGARGAAVSDSVAQRFAQRFARRFAGGTQAVSASRLAAGASADPGIAALLLALALAALTAEWIIRRRGAA